MSLFARLRFGGYIRSCSRLERRLANCVTRINAFKNENYLRDLDRKKFSALFYYQPIYSISLQSFKHFASGFCILMENSRTDDSSDLLDYWDESVIKTLQGHLVSARNDLSLCIEYVSDKKLRAEMQVLLTSLSGMSAVFKKTIYDMRKALNLDYRDYKSKQKEPEFISGRDIHYYQCASNIFGDIFNAGGLYVRSSKKLIRAGSGT